MSLLLSCQSLSKSHGSRHLFQDISFSIHRGDRIGVIGPNGSGKTTLLKILAGIESEDSGTISGKRSLRIAYVAQHPEFTDLTLEETLVRALDQNKEIAAHDRSTQARIVLGRVGFTHPKKRASELSGGWKKRLDIAKALVVRPDLVLFDEPTNHLDLDGVMWLERFLLRENLTFLLVSHDRYFLENVAKRVMEINPAFPKGLFAIDGSYSKFLEKRDEFLSGQAQYEKSMASRVRRELEWLRQSPKARTTKSQSRVDGAQRLVKELENVRTRNLQKKTILAFTATKRGTKKLLVAKNLSITLGEKELFRHLDIPLHVGSRLGIVGSNGSGKTTLLRILAGETLPDKGTIKRADDLKVVYFDQHRETVPLDIPLRKALSPYGDQVNYRGQWIHVNGWCRRFLFTPDRLDLPVGKLSGGERARILIANLMLKPADVLLLDEPTNDLDIPTLEVLEESMMDFPGAVVLITHDRFLMDRVTDQIVALGGRGSEKFFADIHQWMDYEKSHERIDKPAKKKKLKPVTTAEGKKKLSYMEKQELEQMEGAVLDAEEKIEDLHKKVQDPELATNSDKLRLTCEKLDKAQSALDELYARWQELEDRSSL